MNEKDLAALEAIKACCRLTIELAEKGEWRIPISLPNAHYIHYACTHSPEQAKMLLFSIRCLQGDLEFDDSEHAESRLLSIIQLHSAERK